MLRAYRSTLKRSYDTCVADASTMRIKRRISAAFKDIPGGQLLGATYDYTHRLMNFTLEHEDAAALHDKMRRVVAEQVPVPPQECPRVSEVLKTEGLIDRTDPDDTAPFDVTQNLLEFPAPRSAQTADPVPEADAGFIWADVAYSVRCGALAQVHPTVGELRCRHAGSV